MQFNAKPSLEASWIDPRATEIIRRLQDRGHKAYLVGGCVRDLLVGIHPKDFDIVTSALPNEVRKCIPASYIIGKRFRLVLVKRANDQFEVATFRRASRPEDFADAEDTPTGDNFFGTPEEDALRRDFTVNALFFDPISKELIDFADALKDIASKTLRMIGNSKTRIIEDPIRSLRAIRLAHKLNFQLDPELRQAIMEHTAEVGAAILPRRREEYIKFLRLPAPDRAFIEMWDLGLLQTCFPSLIPVFEDHNRLDIFLHYLKHRSEITWDDQQTTLLYAPVLLGFEHALHDLSDFAQRREKFIRDELGIFKAEATDIDFAFQLRERLKNTDLFIKRGARRQQAFLQQPGLALAIKIAAFEQELSPKELWFWQSQLENLDF